MGTRVISGPGNYLDIEIGGEARDEAEVKEGEILKGIKGLEEFVQGVWKEGLKVLAKGEGGRKR